MTEEEKKNISAILEAAKQINRENQEKAMQGGDIETDLRIASNEAKVEAFFRKKGLEIPRNNEI
jgi:hypothetical protein